MNNITSNAVVIRNLFNNRYTVQYYQREYAWGQKQIIELIEDLRDEFFTYYSEDHEQIDVQNYGNYFMGPIILTKENAIIDGQQRLSSMTLLLIYLNHLKSQSSGPKINLDTYIYSEMYGKKTFCINVEERESCLDELYQFGYFDIENEKSESVINLNERYKDIESVFPEELKGSTLPVFIEWLIGKVVFVEIKTDSEQDAHRVFVTMNDRGLRLSSTEMLKGYLLSEINDSPIRNRANDVWKDEILKLKNIEKDGDSDFIKNWLRAQYAKTIREGRKGATDKDYELIGTVFHKWVRENRGLLDLNHSNDYVAIILDNFKLYSNVYIRLKEYSTTYHQDYEYVFYNADREFTLQYQIILAAIDPLDSTETINKKIKVVSAFIDQFIARRVFNFRTVDYSSIRYTAFNITKLVRRNSLTMLADNLSQYVENMNQTLEEIDNFYLNQFTKRYMLHILARITHFIELKSGVHSDFQDYVNRKQKNPYDIEHIWAEDFSQGEHQDEFQTEEEFKDFRNKFGGLILLSKDKNRSLQAMSYKIKVTKYDSENLLARSLNSNCYKNNPMFMNFVKESDLQFKSYDEFNKRDLTERQELYKEIAELIWNPEILKEIGK